MPTFTSCRGGSSGSGKNGIPILDAEEAGELLKLDPKTVDWLKKEPANDDDPLLILSFQDPFVNLGNFDANKQTVFTALSSLGATLISDNVFKFDDWQTMHAAKKKMWISMRWCFYHPHFDTAQQLNISQQPTITTTAITWFSETTGKLTIMPYEFFEL